MNKPKTFATLCGRIFRDANIEEYPSTKHKSKKVILCSQTCLDSFLAEPEVFCKVHRNSEKTAEQIKAELSSMMDMWRKFYDSSKKSN